MVKSSSTSKRAGEKLSESAPSKKLRTSAAPKDSSEGRKPASSAASTKSSARNKPDIIDLSDEVEPERLHVHEVVWKRWVLGGKLFPRFREGDVFIKLGEDVKHTYRLHSLILARASSSFKRRLEMRVPELDDNVVKSSLGRGGTKFRFELRISQDCKVGHLLRTSLTELEGQGVVLPVPIPRNRSEDAASNAKHPANPERSRGTAGQFDGASDDREHEEANNAPATQSQDNNLTLGVAAIATSNANVNGSDHPTQPTIKIEGEVEVKLPQTTQIPVVRPLTVTLLTVQDQDADTKSSKLSGGVPALVSHSEAVDPRDEMVVKSEDALMSGLNDEFEGPESNSSDIYGLVNVTVKTEDISLSEAAVKTEDFLADSKPSNESRLVPSKVEVIEKTEDVGVDSAPAKESSSRVSVSPVDPTMKASDVHFRLAEKPDSGSSNGVSSLEAVMEVDNTVGSRPTDGPGFSSGNSVSKTMEGITVSETEVGLSSVASEPTIYQEMIDLSVSFDSQPGEIDLLESPVIEEEPMKLRELENTPIPHESPTAVGTSSYSSESDTKDRAPVDHRLQAATTVPQKDNVIGGDLHMQIARSESDRKSVSLDLVATNQGTASVPTESTKTREDINSQKVDIDDGKSTARNYYQIATVPKRDKPEKVDATKHEKPQTSTPTPTKPIGPSEDLLEAYHNVFLIYYSQDPIIDATDIEIALEQVELLVNVAGTLNSLSAVRPYIINALVSFGRELYRAIARHPIRWVMLSNMIASPTIFTEGVIHLVGTYSDRPSPSSQIGELGAEVSAMIHKKSDELHALRKEVDRTLFLTSIRIDGREVYLDKDNESTRNSWFVVQVWRDWFTRSLGKAKYDENKSKVARETVYRTIAKGGDAYLPLEDVLDLLEAFHHPNQSNSHFDVREVAKDLNIMKDFAKEIVKPLCINNSMLDVEAEGITYFTCAEVKHRELPQLDTLDLDKA